MIPFVDDGVDMRVPWSERERAAEDVDGEVAWYRAVALGAAFDSASTATRTGAMASLGARHRRWRDDDKDDDESSSVSVEDWPVGDDFLLREAVEAGAALASIARGILPFSRAYSLADVEIRWR